MFIETIIKAISMEIKKESLIRENGGMIFDATNLTTEEMRILLH